jgi:hypothetical protein
VTSIVIRILGGFQWKNLILNLMVAVHSSLCFWSRSGALWSKCFVHGVAPPRFTLTHRVFLLPIDFGRWFSCLFSFTARETSAPVWFLIYAPECSNSVV